MTTYDPKVLFTALGFLAMTLGKNDGGNLAANVQHMAQLMEQFCREQHPEAFAPASPTKGA